MDAGRRGGPRRQRPQGQGQRQPDARHADRRQAGGRSIAGQDHGGARGLDLAQAARIGHDHDRAEQRQLVTDLEHLVELVAVLDDRHGGLGVPDDLANLPGRARGVDRDAPGPGEQDGDV